MMPTLYVPGIAFIAVYSAYGVFMPLDNVFELTLNSWNVFIAPLVGAVVRAAVDPCLA